MSYIKKCCVPGCTDTLTSRHRLPVHNKEVLKVWLDRIRRPDLITYDDKILYNRYFVCSIHFIKECLNGKRLACSSLPTLNIPGFIDATTFKNSFWTAMIYYDNQTQDHTEFWILANGRTKYIIMNE